LDIFASVNYQLISIDDKALEKEFIDFPKRLYKDDANYIMPLDVDIEQVFDPAFNKAFENGACKRWLLKDNGNTIGRIAAFYTKIETTGVITGACGFFESIDNFEAASQLFDVAKLWLIENKCEYMDGPVNFGDRDSFWGLMVEGFASPSYRENYNLPYYQKLFEKYGFTPEIGQTTSLIEKESFNFERFSKLATRVMNNPAYTFDYIHKDNLEKYAKDFIEIYNQAWAFHENFVPMTMDKIMVRMKQMKPILIEQLNVFAYHDGKPVGFYINVLDVNQIFKHVNGKMNLLGKLKFLYYKRFVKRVRGIVFGVIPTHHNLGIEVAMIMHFRAALIKDRFNQNELAWVGDFNPKMLSMFESMGAKPVKKHITYRYNFTN
jgi:hypothetical protein